MNRNSPFPAFRDFAPSISVCWTHGVVLFQITCCAGLFPVTCRRSCQNSCKRSSRPCAGPGIQPWEGARFRMYWGFCGASFIMVYRGDAVTSFPFTSFSGQISDYTPNITCHIVSHPRFPLTLLRGGPDRAARHFVEILPFASRRYCPSMLFEQYLMEALPSLHNGTDTVCG